MAILPKNAPNLGLQPKSPTDNITTQPPKLPPGQVRVSTPTVPNTTQGGQTNQVGSFQGVPITGGTDAQIQAQIQTIKSGGSQSQLQNQIGDIQTQLANKQSQLTQAQNAGYSGNTPIQYDANGRIISNVPQGNQQINQSDNKTYAPNNGLQGQLITGLANRANQPSPQYEEAYNKAQDINQQIAQLNADYGKQTSNIEGSPIDLSLATGQQGILQRLFAAKQSALSGQYQGATNLMNAANTQQQLQQQALQQAGQLNAPVVSQYGQQIFNPAQGVPTNNAGGSLNPINNIQSLAQQVISGQLSPQQAYAMGGGVQNFEGALNQEIQRQSSGFNTAQAQGKYEANQGAATTQGSQIQQYKSSLQQGRNLQAQFTDLLTQFGLNPQDLNMANRVIQAVANNISDPRYKVLNNYVNDIANTYSQILTPPGGTSTDTTRSIATSMIDATMRGTSLIDVMKTLDQQAEAKIAGIPTAGGYGSNSAPSGATSGTLPSGASYVFENGRYVKK